MLGRMVSTPFNAVASRSAHVNSLKNKIVKLYGKKKNITGKKLLERRTTPFSLSIEQLGKAKSPRLICEMGETANEVDVALIGKHAFIPPPQGQR